MKLFVAIFLPAALARSFLNVQNESNTNIEGTVEYPKIIRVVPSRYPSARLELSDDSSQYPNVRIALDEGVSADISKPLPLNKKVQGLVGERDVQMYAAQLPASGGGALKLFVQARGRPAPSEAAPLIISVRTRDGGYTFTLPLPPNAAIHRHSNPTGAAARSAHDSSAAPIMSVSRFMCPSAGARDACYVTMGVGSSAGLDAVDVVYDYELRLMALDAEFWYLETDSAPRGVVVTPAMPAMFQYRWPADPAVRTVRVAAASDDASCAGDTRACFGADCGADGDIDACAYLAVHNPICPLTLTPAEILVTARHLTFTTCGTHVVHRDHFPDGFFVSVLLHEDDEMCCPPPHCGKNETVPRRKSVRVSVIEYDIGFVSVAVPVLMATLFVTIGLMSICLRPLIARAAISTSWQRVAPALPASPCGDVKLSERSVDAEANKRTETDGGDDGETQKRQKSPEAPLYWKRGIVLSPSSMQLTCALLIAAFGVSNVAIDVAAERRTGNFDRCYRNDLCSHDAGVMPDLNHILSNVPYVGAGIGFLMAVYAQRHVYEVVRGSGSGPPRGVPHDFNLFLAIGTALAMEGVTSGLYHVCPNNRNSHIDFFFIYYLCAALGAKLFQTRRGVTARFHYTPALLVAAITLLGSLQQVPGVTGHAWQLGVVLTHFTSSFLWAMQMYLTGHVGLFVPWCWQLTSDLLTRRIAAAHLVFNCGLALLGLFYSTGTAFHSSTYALMYFSLNSGLYVFYYMIMKLVCCRERPQRLSIFFIGLGVAAAFPALFFFVFRNPYNTNESPAQSRTFNRQCVLLGFYDGHDVWHFLSACALFFMMLGVLTLDDDLLGTPRDQIPVF